MIFVADPELRKKALRELRLEYGMDVQRPGLHQSQLTHCLTQTYWDMTDPTPPDDKQVLLFAIGFMFERVMLTREYRPLPFEVDGVVLSLDTLYLFGPADLKTTRKRAAGRKGENGFQMPEGWRRQFASYLYGLNQIMCTCGHYTYHHALGTCFANEFLGQTCECASFTRTSTDSFGVVVLHLVEPELTAWTLQYTYAELEENWRYVLRDKKQLEWMLSHQDPQPFQHNQSWECETCNHSLKCGLLASVQSLQKPSNVLSLEEYR
jgi:hypothetical protein